MRIQVKLMCIVAFLFFLIAGPSMAASLTCTQLATDPSLAANPYVKNLSVTKYGSPSPRCEVNFTYSSRGGPEYGYAVGQMQQVNIRVGLPLNSLDGGTGGIQGAWNGRTRGLGGGGCVGSVGSVTSATNAGYVGSSTDAGHVAPPGPPTCPSGTTDPTCNSCMFALTPDPNKLNIGLLHDFIVDGVVAQVRMSKAIAETYYGMKPNRNYWDGCSTGGRQGFAIAQNYPEELDGWLVGAPGVNYGRFRLAQIWGQIVMKDMVGGPIATGKLNAATASAVAACDILDGVTDGVVNDPRSCPFSATANICGVSGAPAPPNCLTAAEAAAIDKIWDGPRNAWGIKIFPGLPKSAGATGLNGPIPQATASSQVFWEHQDLYFDWHNLTMAEYPYEAELGSTNPVYGGQSLGDIVNTMSVALEPVKKGGKKILMWNGTADGSITTENAMEYYTTVAAHFGHGTPDFNVLQPWFRYYRAPGVGHCGGGAGPQPLNLFESMVSWVETGVLPPIIASGGSAAPPTGRTRPLCPFPQTAIYKGSGSTDDANNFYCGGDLQTKDNVCFGLITPYEQETQNKVDTMGQYNKAACNPNSKVPIGK